MANQWDLVPWMIGGGVKHSLSIARLLSYAAFNGVEGIVGSKDLQVTQLASPGAGVRVWPGACSIKNRQNNAVYEAYAARLPYEDQVDIASTGGAARSDMIVARIEDPFVPGSPWTAPTQAAIDNGTAEFVRTAVISGVAANATAVPPELGYSAIPLARIDLPAGTSAVTQDMITDLRRMTTSRNEKVEKVIYPAAARTLSSTVYGNWPSDANQTVEVPPWATHVQGKAILGGVVYGPGASAGYAHLLLDTVALGGATFFDFPDPATASDRATVLVAGAKTPVPTALRGTSVTAQIEARRYSGSNLIAGTGTGISFELTFSQAPESNT